MEQDTGAPGHSASCSNCWNVRLSDSTVFSSCCYTCFLLTALHCPSFWVVPWHLRTGSPRFMLPQGSARKVQPKSHWRFGIHVFGLSHHHVLLCGTWYLFVKLQMTILITWARSMLPARCLHYKIPFSSCGTIWRLCKYNVPHCTFIYYAYHPLMSLAE